MKLSGNTIFITGGGSGIGRGLAEALHAKGNKVIISGRRRNVLEEVTKANPGMEFIELDIEDPKSIALVADELVKKYPALNVLLNNAGIMKADGLAGVVDDALITSTVTTNLLGPVRMTSALIEHLKKQTAAYVINVTSGLAFVPFAVAAVYSATKAALHSYAMSQRFMLRDTSVRVQEIAPPWVGTGLVGSPDDPRAVPLDRFISETIEALGTDAEEVLIEDARIYRNNPGPGEHDFVNQLNTAMVEALSGLVGN